MFFRVFFIFFEQEQPLDGAEGRAGRGDPFEERAKATAPGGREIIQTGLELAIEEGSGDLRGKLREQTAGGNEGQSGITGAGVDG
ncbi:MAG: hypothetical protein JXA89_21605, partial [Anaerolineae bacterium]|nr:hypothetical protein [Anaerolineae bacterium]